MTVKRFVAYLRTSRVADREEDRVQKWQEEAIERWAHVRGVAVVDWYRDYNISGGREERPALEEALQAVERGDVQGIVVARLDRFSRNVLGALKTLKRIEDRGGMLLSASESIDTTDRDGKIHLHILLGFAEYFLSGVQEQFAEDKARAVRENKFVGVAPFGYRHEDGNLVREPEEAKVVQEAFKRAAVSFEDAYRYLAEQDGRSWKNAPYRVRELLRRRAYLGESSYIDPKEPENSVVNPNAHDAIVTKREWEAGQPEDGPRHAKHGNYALSGIPICGKCGSVMHGAKSGGKRTYRCANRKGCRGVVVLAEPLDAYVRQTLRELLQNHPGYLVGQADEEAVAAAEDALMAREEDLTEFLRDTRLKSIVGKEQFYAEAENRRRAKEQAQVDYRTVAKASAQPVRLDAETVTDDELGELASALRIVVRKVKPGTRGPVSERVSVEPRDN